MQTLTKAEERIMLILWDLKKGFIKDIQEVFPEPKPPYNSISTIVRVLVKKKIVSFKSYGGSYQYYPLFSKEAYRKAQMDLLIINYFGNSKSEVLRYFSKQAEQGSTPLSEPSPEPGLLKKKKKKKKKKK